jgi:hypothetical protein
VNGDQPSSLDAGMEIFVGMRFEIEVVTVKQDRNGKPRTPEHWYSKVREIHPWKAGSSTTRTSQPSNPEPSNLLTLRTQGTLTTDQHSNTDNTPLADTREKPRKIAVSKARGGEIE